MTIARIVAASALAAVVAFPGAATAEGEGRQPAGGAFMSSYGQAYAAPASGPEARPFALPTGLGGPRHTAATFGRHGSRARPAAGAIFGR